MIDPELCPQCKYPSPNSWCWEHDICCPLSKPPRYLDDNPLYPIVRQLIWLLAETRANVDWDPTNEI